MNSPLGVHVRSSGSEFRLQAVFFVIAAIGNLHYPNVRKCPVLSGPFNASPVFTTNPLYQQDLQQFSSFLRPDIPDIRPAAGLSAFCICIANVENPLTARRILTRSREEREDKREEDVSMAVFFASSFASSRLRGWFGCGLAASCLLVTVTPTLH